MSNFPSEYPGHPDGDDTAFNAEIQLAVLEDRGGLSSGDVPLYLTLPDAVDLMLRAYWRPSSKLPKALARGDYIGAAELMRSYDHALDDIRIAPIAIVAGVIKGIVEQLCSGAVKCG